ncbi:MAG: DUF72 domain-containing protein [Chloroflexi bacterium]|nr:DUF72 domain-containing protein [Chloroflexota bacterium]
MPPKYYIGCSGWHYDHWRGLYYPEGLSRSKWLQFYAQQFNTVELNNSFYRLPTEKAFVTWHESSPHNFAFAVKVSRFITHMKRLKKVESAMGGFLSRARLLQHKLGPLLYQLPPNMKRNDELLQNFLSLLPPEQQHVFEFRHQSWIDDAVFNILRQYNCGLCIFDMPGFTCPLVATTDFAYIRFHGSANLYVSCYSDEELSQWAGKTAHLGKNLKAIYIYFNNDAQAFAIKNAVTLTNHLCGGKDGFSANRRTGNDSNDVSSIC